ncbi:MAG TPA: hypothetical protein VG125_18415 [Pirellulales bacterium]|jgi:hypothetical protein|nr:hypothetical protein [Pirellulales bacterium]
MSTLEAPTYVPQSATGGRRPPRRILLGMMVLVLLSGGAIGSGSTLLVINSRIKENEKGHKIDDWSGRIVSELQEKLSLSEKQTAQVGQIMKEHLAALDKLRREVFFKKIRDQFKQMEDQVDAVLDEQQHAQWHAWLEERRKRVCPTGGRNVRANKAAKDVSDREGSAATPEDSDPKEQPPAEGDRAPAAEGAADVTP